MKRFLSSVCVLSLLASQALAANTAVSNFPAVTAVGGTDLIFGVQAAADVKITAAQLLTYVNANAALAGSQITSGTIPASAMPNPSASTLGGVKSLALVANKWISSISTGGQPTATQPACGSLSDSTGFCSLSQTNGVTFAMIAQLTADQILGNFSGVTANIAGATLTSCSAASSALTYNTTTHAFGCNSISGGASPTGLTGDLQTNAGAGAFGAITPGTGVATALAAVVNGSGSISLSTSPTFVTPILGTPTSGVATNLTGTAAGLTAGSVTTNANLTGPITSTGNTTSITSQTGTGTKFVVDTSPVLVTPALGVASGASLVINGTLGAGYVELQPQASAPTTVVTNADRLYVDATGRLSWVKADGFVRALDFSSLTASRVVSFPDLAGIVTEQGNVVSGTGGFCLVTSCVMVTPTLGVALATSINGNTFTAGTYTLTGGGAFTYSLPAATSTLAMQNVAQTFIGLQTFAAIAQGSAVTLTMNTKVLGKTTAPTVSGFCAPTIGNGTSTYAFTVNVGAGCAAQTTGVVTLPSGFTTGSSCFATSSLATSSTVVTAVSTTTTNINVSAFSRTTGATIPWTSSDILQFICFGW